MTKPNENTYDYSTPEGGRQCLQKLISFFIVLLVLMMITILFSSIPEGVQMALDLEAELQTGWKTSLQVGGGLVLLFFGIWGYVDLWRFRKEGVLKLTAVVFMPYFLVEFSPNVNSPFMSYLSGLAQAVTGMILFLCWTRPELFLVSKVPPPVPPL
jgi:hypothetical protein